MEILKAILTMIWMTGAVCVAMALAIAAIGTICWPFYRLRRGREERVWSEWICPQCSIPFGPESAKAAFVNAWMDGGGKELLEIRCQRCQRNFSSPRDRQELTEEFGSISGERLFYTSSADLDSFGGLRVWWDIQMRVDRQMIEDRLRRDNPRLLERIIHIEEAWSLADPKTTDTST